MRKTTISTSTSQCRQVAGASDSSGRSETGTLCRKLLYAIEGPFVLDTVISLSTTVQYTELIRKMNKYIISANSKLAM